MLLPINAFGPTEFSGTRELYKEKVLHLTIVTN